MLHVILIHDRMAFISFDLHLVGLEAVDASRGRKFEDVLFFDYLLLEQLL